MTRSKQDERTKPAREALNRLDAALVSNNSAGRTIALGEVMKEAATLGSQWPVYSAWGLMQKHRKILPKGEVLDLWEQHKKSADQYVTRFVHVVWSHINKLEGGRGAADNEPVNWLRFWLSARERATRATGTAQQNALDECDALLELTTRLFSAVYPDACASDAWVGDLCNQAIAHAQYARCHVNPKNPLSLADGNKNEDQLLVMARALGSVMREHVYENFTILDAATAQLANRPLGDRLNDPMKQADRMGRVLRFWASLDPVVAHILKSRFGTELGTSDAHNERIIPWVKGIEQGIALVGPPQAGKTSLMFASEYVTAECASEIPAVTVRHALDDVNDVNEKRAKWKRREERFNTQQSAKLSAQTELSGLCSFGFFDLSGEEYFPQAEDAAPNREVIRRRYATSPPSVVAMIFKSDSEAAKIGSAFDDLMQTVGQTASEAAGPKITLESLNKSRPVYFLIGKVDLILAKQTGNEEQLALLDDAVVDDRLVRALSAQLTDEVVDLRKFGVEEDSAVAPDLELRIRNNAEMCRTPGRLRAIIDALELTREQRVACGTTSHTNLRLLFVQCGAAPGGRAEFPPIHGVDTFWRHLWQHIPPATAGARHVHLTRVFVTDPTQDLERVQKLARHADEIRIPAWPAAEADALRARIGPCSKALADEILATGHWPASLDKFSAGREWYRENLKFLSALDAIVAPYQRAQDDLETAIGTALHDLLIALGAPPDRAVNGLEGFTAAEPVTEGLSGQVATWRGDFAGRDIDNQSFMFHGAVGALRGSSQLRSEPTKPFETNAALAWLASGEPLERRLSEIFNYPVQDENGEVKADALITEGLGLLADYEPFCKNLAVELLEFDRTKVRALEYLAADLADVRSRGVKAVLALHKLATSATRAPNLAKCITDAATLMTLSGVVREMGFDPVQLLSGARGRGTATQSLTDASEKLLEAKAASGFRITQIFSGKKTETVIKALNSAWALVSEYTTNVRPSLSAEPTQADVVRDLRRFTFVKWYTQNLGASDIVTERDLMVVPMALAAQTAAIAAEEKAAAFSSALRGYIESLREVILKERVRYLIEGNLYEQLSPDARKHLNQLFQRPPGPNPDRAQREARLSNWEETYFKAIKMALEALPV